MSTKSEGRRSVKRNSKNNVSTKEHINDEPFIKIENKVRVSGRTSKNTKTSTKQTRTDRKIKIDNDDEPIEIDNLSSTDTSTNEVEFLSKLLYDYDVEDEQKKDADEDILNDRYFRLALKPIDPNYQTIWDLYKKHVEAFWTADEIGFQDDKYDFLGLDPNVQHFIKRTLAFFAGADSIVNINIRKKFSKITIKEAEVAYGYQQMMENIHGEVYIDMLMNIITDPNERTSLINAFKNVPSIKKMIRWAQEWTDSGRRIAFSIVVFTVFEGLMFSGAFASIYWLKKHLGDDKMKGLVQSNNLIARDEGLHTNFGCLMYSYVIHKISSEEIYVLMDEAVDICKAFTEDAITVDLIGMNVGLMNRYIEYVADRILVCLGYDKKYNTSIPDAFQFMEYIGFLNKDNFFERRSTEYQKAYSERNTANWEFKILENY